jgi:hypothetical protein
VKRALVIAACAACGHAPAPAGPEHDLDVGRGSAIASGSAASTTDAAALAHVPALAGDGPHAFVADAGGLIEVAPSGQTAVIAPVKPGWCAVDARAQVVWFTGDEGLFAFDLTDRAVRPVVSGQLDLDTVTIDWGTERLGGEDKLAYQVALGVRMSATPPKLSSELGCDGDEAVYCYDPSGHELRPDLVERERKLDALALADGTYVASLAARGRDRSLWTPPPMPPAAPARKPKVDRKACETSPEKCGQRIAIPGSALWLVVTANSRGDFYHETRELWDPATGEYVWVAGGRVVRAAKPQRGDSDYADLRIAPTGGLLSIGGVVFDPAQLIYAPSGDGAITCGWSTGGWRMPSPTE